MDLLITNGRKTPTSVVSLKRVQPSMKPVIFDAKCRVVLCQRAPLKISLDEIGGNNYQDRRPDDHRTNRVPRYQAHTDRKYDNRANSACRSDAVRDAPVFAPGLQVILERETIFNFQG